MSDFASRIKIELKRAERYRIFVSLVVFNLGQVLEIVNREAGTNGKERCRFRKSLEEVIRRSIREIDSVSNSGLTKVGLLFPETPRQGAEAAARRIADNLNRHCSEYLGQSSEYLIPVEISSFPDAAGARPVSSYLDEFAEQN